MGKGGLDSAVRLSKEKRRLWERILRVSEKALKETEEELEELERPAAEA